MTSPAFSTLLVALDGSPGSGEAFDVALALAAASHARLELCTVVDASTFAGFAPPSRQMDQAIAIAELEGKALLDRSLQRAGERGVACHGETLLGDPKTEIVEYAKRLEPSAIVIGTHGRSGLRRVLMGSVAESVLRRAPCPVITVRQHRKERH
ncbi:MAG TPA: universal stress protein [Candidatus Acidoferrales bacterium]|nr:universal stress protein [Candidatus Acidoferrales bacterium]